MVYLAAAGFLISVFPIYVYNYVYINTDEKYASINVTLYRYIRLLNVNTVKNKPGEMQINGKNKSLSFENFKISFFKILNMLCVYKIVQLSDFGLKSNTNAYIALAHNTATTAMYNLIQINGNRAKLKNYTVLNEEHSAIRYYAKTVTIVNVLVITKVFLIILMEKLNEYKNQKKQRKGI